MCFWHIQSRRLQRLPILRRRIRLFKYLTTPFTALFFIFPLRAIGIFLRFFYRSNCTLINRRSEAIARLSFSNFPRGNTDGYRVFAVNGGVLCGDRVIDHRLQSIEGAIMSWIYLLSGGLTLAVFVYLVVALFYPEKF
ncbi:MAG: potassium-transporting ATPase subunit F [Methylococcaceae bacterium]|nr:potassium-transporting ATPase subunit F [Methylococcaceae bacterium]